MNGPADVAVVQLATWLRAMLVLFAWGFMSMLAVGLVINVSTGHGAGPIGQLIRDVAGPVAALVVMWMILGCCQRAVAQGLVQAAGERP